MLYKGDKDVNNAACPPEGGPAETGGLSVSSLPLIFEARPTRMPDGPAKKAGARIQNVGFISQTIGILMTERLI